MDLAGTKPFRPGFHQIIALCFFDDVMTIMARKQYYGKGNHDRYYVSLSMLFGTKIGRRDATSTPVCRANTRLLKPIVDRFAISCMFRRLRPSFARELLFDGGQCERPVCFSLCSIN
jgi:hypothetical protein